MAFVHKPAFLCGTPLETCLTHFCVGKKIYPTHRRYVFSAKQPFCGVMFGAGNDKREKYKPQKNRQRVGAGTGHLFKNSPRGWLGHFGESINLNFCSTDMITLLFFSIWGGVSEYISYKRAFLVRMFSAPRHHYCKEVTVARSWASHFLCGFSHSFWLTLSKVTI